MVAWPTGWWTLGIAGFAAWMLVALERASITFVSVLRFAATHFSARRYPLLVALTGMTGTAGNVLATLNPA